uniref:ATP synthase complex subunit 8 n=1 Tax=Choerocoris paganus TaxID=468237 RepID=A0A2P1CLQ5_9HEMI|nr:ATP synthase F0 subunit 8 [Choerocoris paganus]
MPQMAPLYWELLFILFIISMMMMKIIIFHLIQAQPKSSTVTTNEIKQINWKW